MQPHYLFQGGHCIDATRGAIGKSHENHYDLFIDIKCEQAHISGTLINNTREEIQG